LWSPFSDDGLFCPELGDTIPVPVPDIDCYCSLLFFMGFYLPSITWKFDFIWSCSWLVTLVPVSSRGLLLMVWNYSLYCYCCNGISIITWESCEGSRGEGGAVLSVSCDFDFDTVNF